MGISRLQGRERALISPPGSPWQNGCAERLIGTMRRECLDRMLIFGESHLRRILSAYAAYYNQSRTHLALKKDALASSSPTVRCHRRHSHLGRTASSICSDMIFGKDKVHRVRGHRSVSIQEEHSIFAKQFHAQKPASLICSYSRIIPSADFAIFDGSRLPTSVITGTYQRSLFGPFIFSFKG
jgi:hypothetical protein